MLNGILTKLNENIKLDPLKSQQELTTFLKDMFNQINQDCQESDELVVDFSDEEFYSEQIMNIFEVDEDESKYMSKLLNS